MYAYIFVTKFIGIYKCGIPRMCSYQRVLVVSKMQIMPLSHPTLQSPPAAEHLQPSSPLAPTLLRSPPSPHRNRRQGPSGEARAAPTAVICLSPCRCGGRRGFPFLATRAVAVRLRLGRGGVMAAARVDPRGGAARRATTCSGAAWRFQQPRSGHFGLHLGQDGPI